VTTSRARKLQLLGVVAVALLLVWAAAAASTMSILVAFTLVVTLGLFLVPKAALAIMGVYLLAQSLLVNLAGGPTTPLGLALHRLHQAFVVAAAIRVVVFMWWKPVAPRLRPWLWLTAAFLVLGTASGFLQHVPLTTLALGAFLAVKFPVLLLAALTVAWDERDCERIARWTLWLGPFLLISGIIIWLAPPEVQDLFVDHSLETEFYGREEFAAMQGIFNHPAVFGWAVAWTGCYAIAGLLAGRRSWRAIGAGSLLASVAGILVSLRRKPLLALPLATLYGVMRFGTGRRRWTVLALFALLGGTGVWLATPRLEAEYRDALTYVDPTGATVPRVLLYVTGVEIANARFPLGAGFGRFGGYASVLDYSPLYDEYGLSQVWGLSQDTPYYLQDTYWPHIAAEAGWFGALIVLVLYLLLGERTSRVALSAKDDATRVIAIGATLALVEGLIESAAGPVFEIALFAYAVAVPLGIALVRGAAIREANALSGGVPVGLPMSPS